MAKTRDIDFLTVLEFWTLEVQSPRSVDLVSSEVSLLSLQMATLSSCPLMVAPWSMCECVLISSYEDTSQIRLGFTHVTSWNINYLFKGPISKCSHI